MPRLPRRVPPGNASRLNRREAIPRRARYRLGCKHRSDSPKPKSLRVFLCLAVVLCGGVGSLRFAICSPAPPHRTPNNWECFLCESPSDSVAPLQRVGWTFTKRKRNNIIRGVGNSAPQLRCVSLFPILYVPPLPSPQGERRSPDDMILFQEIMTNIKI